MERQETLLFMTKLQTGNVKETLGFPQRSFCIMSSPQVVHLAQTKQSLTVRTCLTICLCATQRFGPSPSCFFFWEPEVTLFGKEGDAELVVLQ